MKSSSLQLYSQNDPHAPYAPDGSEVNSVPSPGQFRSFTSKAVALAVLCGTAVYVAQRLPSLVVLLALVAGCAYVAAHAAHVAVHASSPLVSKLLGITTVILGVGAGLSVLMLLL